MTLRLLTKHHLEFLSFKGVCTGLSESTLVNMPHFLEIKCCCSYGLMVVIIKLPSLDDDGGGVLICSSSIWPERVTI